VVSETIGGNTDVVTGGDVRFRPSSPYRWLILVYLIGTAGLLIYFGVLMLQSTRAIWIGSLLVLIVVAAVLGLVILVAVAIFRPIRIVGNVL
jgi:hypothetical protein